MTALFLRFRKNVHHSTIALRPVALRQAMHKANVQIVGAKLFASQVVRARAVFGSRAHVFVSTHNLVARNLLQRFSHMRMTPICIRRIEESQAVVISIQKQPGKALEPELRLVRTTAEADRSRPPWQDGSS